MNNSLIRLTGQDGVVCKSPSWIPQSGSMTNVNSSIFSDVHIYYLQTNPEQSKYASELWQRIRRECGLLTNHLLNTG